MRDLLGLRVTLTLAGTLLAGALTVAVRDATPLVRGALTGRRAIVALVPSAITPSGPAVPGWSGSLRAPQRRAPG